MSAAPPYKASILIVDDEQNLRLTLADILCDAGYQVMDACCGHEALRLLQAGPFDLMFVDLQMPDMSGMELLRHVRAINPDLPVLILTAHASLNSAVEAVRNGARDYLFKPADPHIILARVKEVLQEQQLTRRQRSLMAQIQTLVEELQQISAPAVPPGVPSLAAPPTSSTRFLQRPPLVIDLHARHALWNGRLIDISPSSFDYLVTLARYAPQPVSFEDLVRYSQGYEADKREARSLARWYVYQLRQALEPDPQKPVVLLTVRSVGYRLALD